MDRRRALPWRKATVLAVLTLALAGLAPASTAEGQVRRTVPEQSQSGPFYARIERGAVLQTDEWVAIPFYRDPACVRPGFNLLNFFDFANIPAIFGCSLTVHGFELWDDPTSDSGPKLGKLEGNGSVPVWFVSVEDFYAALPGVTMDELRAMPSLIQGVASHFEETLRPMGSAQQTGLEIVASGVVPDGRTFHLVAIEAVGTLRHVSIAFR